MYFRLSKEPVVSAREGCQDGVYPLAALYLNFFAARTRQARLCCCLMLYFGIGIIVTGVSGI